MVDTEDNVYYNITIRKNESNRGLAVFNETRVVPILDNPDDYELAVIRFNIPMTNIPIMYFDDKNFIVSMEYNGLTHTAPLVWIPNNLDPGSRNSVWSYQELLNMINTAFQFCFNSLKGAFPGAPPTEAPFMTYDAATQLFTLNAEQTYNVDGPPTFKLYFNSELDRLFPSIDSFEQSNLDPFAHQLLVRNNRNNQATINGKPYYKMVSEYPTLALWNDLKSVIIESDRIPVNPELQQGQVNVTRRIITDFEPLSDINNRQSLQYFPAGPLRFYDLKSNYPLNSIDARVYWQTYKGEIIPVTLIDFEVLTIKLMFRKKLKIQLAE